MTKNNAPVIVSAAAPRYSPLALRLLECAERAGGKRALAAEAHVSEAQLYRYLDDETAIPHDKLNAFAKAGKVDSGWLLTGWGQKDQRTDRPRPDFRPALLVELQEALDLLLVEYQRTIPPTLRSRMLAYLYSVLRHEEAKTGELTEINKFKMLQFVSFLSELRTEAELDVMQEAFEVLEYRGLEPDYKAHHQLLTTWCNLLVRGMRGYYNSYAGQVYFERMGQTLSTEAVSELHSIVELAVKTIGKQNLDWLDLGCGNGRHLAHLHKHMPNLHLRGLELSDLGVELCHKLEASERLPEGCVQQGDARMMPLKAESFDVIFSRYSLQSLPYLKNCSIGICEAISEIYRILKPNGMGFLILPRDSFFDFLTHQQNYTESMTREIAKGSFKNYQILDSQHGFKDLNMGLPKGMGYHENRIYLLLRKQ